MRFQRGFSATTRARRSSAPATRRISPINCRATAGASWPATGTGGTTRPASRRSGSDVGVRDDRPGLPGRHLGRRCADRTRAKNLPQLFCGSCDPEEGLGGLDNGLLLDSREARGRIHSAHRYELSVERCAVVEPDMLPATAVLGGRLYKDRDRQSRWP